MDAESLNQIKLIVEEVFDRKFDEKFDEKFDKAFDRAFDRRITPFAQKLDMVYEQTVRTMIDVGELRGQMMEANGRLDSIEGKLEDIEDEMGDLENQFPVLIGHLDRIDERLVGIEKH